MDFSHPKVEVRKLLRQTKGERGLGVLTALVVTLRPPLSFSLFHRLKLFRVREGRENHNIFLLLLHLYLSLMPPALYIYIPPSRTIGCITIKKKKESFRRRDSSAGFGGSEFFALFFRFYPMSNWIWSNGQPPYFYCNIFSFFLSLMINDATSIWDPSRWSFYFINRKRRENVKKNK